MATGQSNLKTIGSCDYFLKLLSDISQSTIITLIADDDDE